MSKNFVTNIIRPKEINYMFKKKLIYVSLAPPASLSAPRNKTKSFIAFPVRPKKVNTGNMFLRHFFYKMMRAGGFLFFIF